MSNSTTTAPKKRNWFNEFITSSIGRKIVMSITGLFLISFLVVHMLGNLQLFMGDEHGRLAFNAYTKFMTTNEIIRIMEIVLVLGFALHIYTGILLLRQNPKARPVKYAYDKANESSSWFSRNMGLSGIIVLLFLFIHLANFWAQYKFGTPQMDSAGNKDMYEIVKVTFQNEWWFSVFYAAAMVLLGFHLNHGFQSAFQSLGINHPKYTPFLHKLGAGFSIIVPGIFAAMPIYFLVMKFVS